MISNLNNIFSHKIKYQNIYAQAHQQIVMLDCRIINKPIEENHQLLSDNGE